jgi:hypothetical protein
MSVVRAIECIGECRERVLMESQAIFLLRFIEQNSNVVFMGGVGFGQDTLRSGGDGGPFGSGPAESCGAALRLLQIAKKEPAIPLSAAEA